jgi:pimeloyl-ACP methyl ester carboxylesterase
MLPVVCLPGLMSTGAVYARVPGLEGAQILTLPDLSDFGAIAEGIAARLPPRCVVVGHSMGGYLALELWRRAPGQIAGLALLSTQAHADTQAGAEARGKAVRYAQKAGIAALATAVAAQALGPAARDDTGMVAQVLAMAQAVGVDTFARHQTALAGRPDNTALLATITCPVLALTGAEDTVTPPAAGRALAEGVPGGRFHMIPGAGHILPLEAPEAVAAHLRPFLNACAAEAAA